MEEHAKLAQITGSFVDDDTGQTMDKVNKWKEIFDFTPDKEPAEKYKLTPPDDFSVLTFVEIADEFDLD